MREARIAMRTIEAARRGQEVTSKDLNRTAGAAERVVRNSEKRKNDQATALAWLKARGENEIGVDRALAKLLHTDAGNLAKLLNGKRTVTPNVQSKIDLHPQTVIPNSQARVHGV